MHTFRLGAVRLGLLVVGLLLMAAGSARGSFVMNIVESGANVVATGSGKINTLALIFPGSSISFLTTIEGDIAKAIINPNNDKFDFYVGISGPSSFGTPSSGFIKSLIDSGDTVGILGSPANVSVPLNYVSGAALSDSATFQNVSFAALHLTPGSYVWNWGTGAAADSFTVNIGPVPEPACLGLAGVGAVGVLLRRRGRGMGK